MEDCVSASGDRLVPPPLESSLCFCSIWSQVFWIVSAQSGEITLRLTHNLPLERPGRHAPYSTPSGFGMLHSLVTLTPNFSHWTWLIVLCKWSEWSSLRIHFQIPPCVAHLHFFQTIQVTYTLLFASHSRKTSWDLRTLYSIRFWKHHSLSYKVCLDFSLSNHSLVCPR